MSEIDMFEQEVRRENPRYCRQIIRYGSTVRLLFDTDARLISEYFDDIIGRYPDLEFVESLGGYLRRHSIEEFGFTYDPDMEEWDDMTIYGIVPRKII